MSFRPVGRPALHRRRPPASRRDQTERGGQVQRVLLLTALAAVSALAWPSTVGAASRSEFKAQFHDDDCTAHAQCGTGLVEGYGHVTTTLDVTGGVFDPATGCL